MKLGQETQEKINKFLCESFVEFFELKKLTPKKAILINEYTKFLQNKIVGK